MRKPIVAGNWKMNKTAAEAQQLVYEMKTDLLGIEGVEKVFCPSYLAITTVADLLKGTEIGVGAQNLHWETKGAYTGEVTGEMIAEFAEFVIIGHSERRAMFGETDETVNKKVHAALAAGLKPIVCVGETYDENQAGETGSVVTRQVKALFEGVSKEDAAGFVIAYEPVWAIGTGLAAEPVGANNVIRDYIRQPIAELYDETVAQQVRVQYGGSVKPGNAVEYFSQPDIDGALVGGASLKAADFIEIVRAAS
jgi:triosephosphate isomerase